MKYFKLQSNRATIKKILDNFEKNIIDGEIIVVPRPLPKQNMLNYIAFIAVSDESENFKQTLKVKNVQPLTSTQFKQNISKIQFSWSHGLD